MGQVLDYRHAWAGSRRNLSFSLDLVFLSRGNSGGDLDDGRFESVAAGFCGLVRAGATLVCWSPVVWWEGPRSLGLSEGRLRYRLRLGVQLYRDQLPDFPQFGFGVVPEEHLDCMRCFSYGSQQLRWDCD
jgi:hypothetical protein